MTATCPTRKQWLVLATLREGATKYIKGPNQRAGNLRTALSVRKRGWVLFDEAQGYVLTAAGQAALAAGDRRYLESERAYARRPL